MRTGRRPRPTALKVLQGERPSRINDDEIPGTVGVPPPPGDLDAATAAAYGELAVMLEPTGVVTSLDGPALVAFAVVLVAHGRAAALEAMAGPLVVDDKGQPRVNPASRVRRDAGRDVLRWASEFGMTPASRSQIRARLAGTPTSPAPNPTAARYLTGGAPS